MTKLKICGLTSMSDIEIVNQYRPDYIGFVFAKSRRQIDVKTAKKLKSGLGHGIQAVGVFVNEDMNTIIELLNHKIIDLAQLHGNETEEMINIIKTKTGKPVIKAISVYQEQDILQWKNSCVDYLLLDHGAGGTGQCFDWNLIPEIKIPFFLAGGITAENVQKALRIKPFGIDTSSGVETDGIKDALKIKEIVNIVKNNVDRKD